MAQAGAARQGRAGAMPIPSGLSGGCCALERATPEGRLQAAGRLPQPARLVEGRECDPAGIMLEAADHLGEDQATPSSSRHWQGWLQAWEHRQRTQMEQHEEATRELVEGLKEELLTKMAQLEKAKVRNKKPTLLKATEPGMEQKETDGLSLSNRSGPRTAGDPKPVVQDPARMSYSHLNDAMLSAAGGAKVLRGQTSGTTSQEPDGVGTESVWSLDLVYRPHTRWQAALYHFTNTRAFELVSSGVIIAYTIAVGVMSDLDMRAAIDHTEPPKWRWWVDMSFNSFFLVEVFLRMLAEGCHYFLCNKKRGWNIFDLLVAAAGMIDIVFAFDVSLAFLRILRTFRAIRVLRVVRIFRFFKELRLMVASILCCLVSLSWAFTLLISVMYIFAVVLMQGASDYLLGETQVDSDTRLQLGDDFGNLLKTIYSLTQAVSGGRSWGEYAAPFIVISPWYGVAFTLFIVFVIFGVLNILTGVFVESTSAVAHYDKELVIQEEMSRNESVINQMRALFSEIDVDKSGTISYKELRRNLKDDRVKAYFSVLQMDVSEAQGLFQLLDRDESGEVSIEEFIMTCLRLKGAARSIDLATMLFEHKRLYSMVRNVRVDLAEMKVSIRELNRAVDELNALS
uniref:EF-hand domain-containing protein n=1 Tax=Alexandrium monilatum TaxID=311494 RepID=A0A7S4VMT2_9DINO